jgi:hypothetical protein
VIDVEQVTAPAGVKLFAALPRHLYRGMPGYVPPLDIIQRDVMTPAKNPYFTHAEAAFWIATSGGKPVGRISAQVDTLENDKGAVRTGHFGNLAAIDDAKVVAALFNAAEGWLRERGCTRVTGPFNLSVNGESGLMVMGQEEQAMFLMPWDPPYLGSLVEQAGYGKVRDLHSFVSTAVAEPLEMARRMAAKSANMKITTRHAKASSIADELDTVLTLFNDAWENNWGFVQMTRDELAHMAKDLKPLLTDECLSIVEVDGKPEAFALALPNLTEMSADLDGRLLPFGWAKLAWRVKRRKYATGRLLLMGVGRKYRDSAMGAGLALMAIEKMREGAHKIGIRSAELGWVLDDNKPMLRMLGLLGARLYKTHRVYEKSLS